MNQEYFTRLNFVGGQPPRHGLALIFDLEGFSQFFAQPDSQEYIPSFLNNVFGSLNTVIHGGKPYWLSESTEDYDGFSEPIHVKYLGDGALYLWEIDHETLKTKAIELSNRLLGLRKYFSVVVKNADVPVTDVPRRIRFGLAAGSLYQLTEQSHNTKEYVGYCVNLAARLQSYCKDLGFIASARAGIPEDQINSNGLLKVVAKNIRGFPKEIVIVDKQEYTELNGRIKGELFEKFRR